MNRGTIGNRNMFVPIEQDKTTETENKKQGRKKCLLSGQDIITLMLVK